MSEPVLVRMPSGDVVWVSTNDDEREVEDVSLPGDVLAAVTLPGFVDTVHGVVGSVRMAFERHRPDTVAVEFGVEINAKTGKVLSVLAEAGGKAHLKVTATWHNGTLAPAQAVEEQRVETQDVSSEPSE